jgi:hypothetical protein
LAPYGAGISLTWRRKVGGEILYVFGKRNRTRLQNEDAMSMYNIEVKEACS